MPQSRTLLTSRFSIFALASAALLAAPADGIQQVAERQVPAAQSAIDPDAPSGGGSGRRTFKSWTPIASVSLKAPDAWLGDLPIEHLMTYFTYSRGFKGGGFNATTQVASDLTVISNNCGSGEVGLAALLKAGRVSKVICSFPRTANSTVFPELYRSGFTELELVPQGTLAERIRAGGAGIPAFFTPSAVGTSGRLSPKAVTPISLREMPRATSSDATTSARRCDSSAGMARQVRGYV